MDSHKNLNHFLYCWSRLFSSQLESNDSFDFHTKWKIINSKNGHTILTDLFELHIIELPKALKVTNLSSPIVQWMFFLNNPNTIEVLEMSEKNLSIEEALKRFSQISQNKELQRAIELE